MVKRNVKYNQTINFNIEDKELIKDLSDKLTLKLGIKMSQRTTVMYAIQKLKELS